MTNQVHKIQPTLAKSTKDLAVLVKLEQAARQQENPADLYDFIVHQTRTLLHYDIGALWLKSEKDFVAITDVEMENKNNPAIELLEHIARKTHGEPISKIFAEDVDSSYQEQFKRYLFKNTIVVELKLHQEIVAVLILSREEMWHKHEMVLLDHLRSCYALCLGYQDPAIVSDAYWKRLAKGLFSKKFMILFFILLFCLLFFYKVPLTVLAPAEVSSKTPVYIRSAIDGVIEEVLVKPNSLVKEGDKLVTLNKQNIEARLNILQKKLALVETQYRVATKSGLSDQREKKKIPVLKIEIQKNIAEIDYYKGLSSQTDIFSPKSGLVLFEQTQNLEGKPVKTGENIMMISDEKESAIDIYFPVSDAVDLKAGSPVRLFLNISPKDPLDANIQYSSFRAETRPDNTLAYHVKAHFNDEDPDKLPRIGLRGVAKLYGDEVTLWYYLMRKPLSYMRQKLGI